MKEWIALNMTPGVGPRAAAKLLERFGSPEAVFGALRSELERLRIRPEAIESIVTRNLFERAGAELERVRALGGDIILLDDGVYPAPLREIFDPPLTLYARGNWAECLDAPCVGVVGSRQCSTYGRNAAEMLSRDLASRGVTIVSGLARGIDAAAHRGALDAGGRTVAVMATGLDDTYPREHEKLAQEIVDKGGALITQFPLETPPLPENFPYRNRIISGLSLGVVVTEATERSGSLITARLALEQNREVFAVPGNITSRTSFGANYLIKSAGAKLVQQWQDIAAELPPEIAAQLLPPKPITGKKGAKLVEQLALIPEGLTADEQTVFALLSPAEPLHIDEVATRAGLSVPQLAGILLSLEMRELIRQLPGKRFARKV
jgi:DNA processing protein